MRTLNWNKIPAQKVLAGGRKNLWRRIAESHSGGAGIPLDFAHLEGLFCQQQLLQPSASSHTAGSGGNGGGAGSGGAGSGSEAGGRTGSRDPASGRSGDEAPLRILDAQRSLQVGIFLKQLRGQADESLLLEHLSRGGGSGGGSGGGVSLGADKLRALQALLPAPESASALEAALLEREAGQLAPPEAFLAKILRLPDYRLRVESLLLQEELPTVVASLETSMTCLRNAAKEIQECKALHEVLYMILVAGNFLNSGGYAGNAAGFQVMSLLKVAELRSNRPGIGLIHYVAQEADRTQLLGRSGAEAALPTLDAASRVSGDQVRTDVSALAERVAKLQADASRLAARPPHSRDDAFLERTHALIELAQRELERLRRGLRNVEQARTDLAAFFCEDPAGFQLEECFGVIATFWRSFRAADQENRRRSLAEPDGGSTVLPRGPVELVRLRAGGADERGATTSASSPDASPSNSLRRSFRRSRPSSSEVASDDPLLDFLQRHGSDREDSLGRRASRREARRRWAADLSEDSTSRERVPPRESDQLPAPPVSREQITTSTSSAAADPPAYVPRRTFSKLPSAAPTSVGSVGAVATEVPRSTYQHNQRSKPTEPQPPPASTAPPSVPVATPQVSFARTVTSLPLRTSPSPSEPLARSVPALAATTLSSTPAPQVSFVHSSSSPRRSALPSPTITTPRITTPPTTTHVGSVLDPSLLRRSALSSPPPRMTTPPPATALTTTTVRSPPPALAPTPPPIPESNAPTPVRREGWTRSAIPTMPGSTVLKRSPRVSPSDKPFMRATSAWNARSGPLHSINGTAQSGSPVPTPYLSPPSQTAGAGTSGNAYLERRMPLQPIRDRQGLQRLNRPKTTSGDIHQALARWRSSRPGMSSR